jgi:hypothetical protein
MKNLFRSCSASASYQGTNHRSFECRQLWKKKVKKISWLLILLLLSVTPASAQCLSQAQARQAVASGQAKSLGSVRRQAGGEIVKATLCRQGGGYVYRLQVLVNGRVVGKTVNASR